MRASTALLLLTWLLPAQDIDTIRVVVERAIHEGQCPGAVFLTGSGSGSEALGFGVGAHADPTTIFDCASLTKVVATTTCVMQLVDTGELELDDRVADHLPGFGQNGKDVITIEQLLLHRGGLLPDNALRDYEHGEEEARRRIFALGLRAQPGTATIYTDVGYIVLGWIVEKLTGQSLDERARTHVFEPLGMTDTRFVRTGQPAPTAWVGRCAPTEPPTPGAPDLQGVVHDPRARLLGGVAGHAGMFSTAPDLMRFGRMILRGGVSEQGKRVLSTLSVKRMTTRATNGDRAIGWRVRGTDTAWHTGFTGTALWMDRKNDRVTVLLSSRLHPDGKGDVRNLREEVSHLVGCGPDRVATGVDVIARRGWPTRLRGARVGLITNHTGRTRAGRSTIDVLNATRHVELVRLFSPEHGIRGELDSKVGDSVDEKTGLAVVSLYGKNRKPTAASLEGIDTLVFDIQDIGTRFYTYISTMVGAMEVASARGVRFVVLDRPNPIGGVRVNGPIADADALDFVGYLRVPIRHGMTVGEIALLAREESGLEALDLRVIRCEGWWRGDDQKATAQPWINPSPNMRSLTEAYLYPGVGIIETTNVSVGRGTATPFEVVGAPWMDGEAIARAIESADIPGVRVSAVTFTPNASKFANRSCSGVRFTLTDAGTLDSLRLGLTLASTLLHLHGDAWDTRRLDRLLKHNATRRALIGRSSYANIERAWAPELRRFLSRRREFLLYPQRR